MSTFFNFIFIFGIVAFIASLYSAMKWKPFRKAIGLTCIILGTILSLTLLGAILGIPMIIFGAILLFMERKENQET